MAKTIQEALLAAINGSAEASKVPEPSLKVKKGRPVSEPPRRELTDQEKIANDMKNQIFFANERLLKKCVKCGLRFDTKSPAQVKAHEGDHL